MKRFELLFTFLQLPLDFFALILAGATAYSLRYAKFITAIRPILFDLSWAKFFPALLAVATAWVVLYALSGLYTTSTNRKFASDVLRIIMASSSGFAGITIYVFFTLQKFDSRFLVLVGYVIAVVYVITIRLCMRGLKSLLYRQGFGLRRTVIIGTDEIASTIANHFIENRGLGYDVTNRLNAFGQAEQKMLEQNLPDEIIITNPKANEKDAIRAINFASLHHIAFKYSADLFETISSNMQVTTIAGIPVVELRRTRLSGWGRIIKRSADIIGALFFLLLFSPLMLVVAIIILIETGRPIIYKNERVGQYNKKFFTLKFRSMHQALSTGEQFGEQGKAALKFEEKLIKTNGSKNGPVYKIKNDPRVTRFGRLIRRLSIDELPQFWNVLVGDMSLVGPRPHQPREVDKYDKEHPVLFAIKPGITGLAQISGRSSLSFEEEARLDTFYIENWNLYLDIIILFKTPLAVLKGKGAL